jgi:hypothetical protein
MGGIRMVQAVPAGPVDKHDAVLANGVYLLQEDLKHCLQKLLPASMGLSSMCSRRAASGTPPNFTMFIAQITNKITLDHLGRLTRRFWFCLTHESKRGEKKASVNTAL